MKDFVEKLYSEWLPSFCNARSSEFVASGFIEKSLDRISQFDVHWFLKAVESGLVAEESGFFVAPLSKAKEQIFWERNGENGTKKLFIWAEPIITIGACARLVEEYGWPIELVGMQSEYPWPFDLVCYEMNLKDECIVCEVKKFDQELYKLVGHMKVFSEQNPLKVEPSNSVEKNAYRKVVGLRKSQAKFFWALGPKGNGNLFKLDSDGNSELFEMNLVDEASLQYRQF